MILQDFKHYIYILKESNNKFEVLKYPFKRFLGKNTLSNKPITLKNKLGIWYCDKIMENCLVASSSFEPEILKEMLKINNGTFIDVGAHIGKYSIVMSKNLGDKGQVVSIEADKRNLALLNKNIELNKAKNIDVYNFVCLDNKGKVTFYISDSNPATNSYLDSNGKRKIELNSDTIDNLNLKNVTCIKIDIEGSEPLALKGAFKTIKKYHPIIIFESRGKEHYETIVNILSKFRYKINNLTDSDYIAK